MGIPIYLALSAAEFLTCAVLPPKAAWMACHFSPGGNGLCNLPDSLPGDSLLIFDDSTPYQEHDFNLILSQLSDAVATLKPDAILLDFQRPGVAEVRALVALITEQLPCPVIVSSLYAENLDCGIFLPPGPLDKPLAEYLKPYQGREIWLDAAPVCAQIVITEQSSQYTPHPMEVVDGSWHFDAALHCHYRSKIEEQQIVFTLSRSCNDLAPWFEEAEKNGVSCVVGLYQELKEILY